MNFGSMNDVLTFAIRQEHNSRELYLMFRDMVKDPAAKTLLEELANQELGHKQLLEKALAGENIEKVGAKKDIKDLHLSDYLVSEEVSEESDAQDVMIHAMKKEKAAYDLYHTIADNYSGSSLGDLFSRLATEELRHKEILEREYDEHFMQWM